MSLRGGIDRVAGSSSEITSEWRREHGGSGLTSRLILAYVEREAGGQAVRRLLARAGLSDAEERLRDENHWFSYDTKIALWAAAEEVLEDRHVAEHAGAAVLDLSVAMALKRTLRALGTPGFVYNNVVRASGKFNWAQEMQVLDSGDEFVRMRLTDVSGVGYHRYDCEYTTGLLATVPQLFGLPVAHVRHTICGAEGGPWCEFEVQWTAGTHALKRIALALLTGGAVVVGAGALLEPVLVPVAAGLLVVGEAAVGLRAMGFMRRRLDVLEGRVREQDDAAERLLSSLEDLSSDLRLDEVLGQITAKAQTAVGGKEFALLLAERGGMRADRHSGIPAASLKALVAWADDHRAVLLERGTVVVDDVATDPTLGQLLRPEHAPFGSICAAPLVFKDELLGVLAALSHGSTVFFPGEASALSAYAAHAAIALSNARLVDRLEHQAAEDPLTGLANQRAFHRHCAVEFSRAQRSRSEVSILMLDLDHFKTINDVHGHLHGDQVLIGVADALRTATRGHDTVARLGGEEFAILLPDTGAAAAFDIAERIRSAVARTAVSSSTLSCSAGVATALPNEASYVDVLELADKALYEAKRRGRDRTIVSSGRGTARSSTAA